jgi:hypothetical protein
MLAYYNCNEVLILHFRIEENSHFCKDKKTVEMKILPTIVSTSLMIGTIALIAFVKLLFGDKFCYSTFTLC